AKSSRKPTTTSAGALPPLTKWRCELEPHFDKIEILPPCLFPPSPLPSYVDLLGVHKVDLPRTLEEFHRLHPSASRSAPSSALSSATSSSSPVAPRRDGISPVVANAVQFLHQAWTIYYRVFKRITHQLPQIVALELRQVSPKLVQAKDLTLAVPGECS
ncbi:MAG: hypothetical protein AAFY15_13025, partial [Cyanobacteria bacterium J06648_11]